MQKKEKTNLAERAKKTVKQKQTNKRKPKKIFDLKEPNQQRN